MSVRQDIINLFVNVDGNKSRNELNELQKKSADLNAELKGFKKNTQEYIDKSKEIAKVKDEIDKLKLGIGLTSLTQKELNAEVRKLEALRGSVEPFTEAWKAYDEQLKKVKDRQYEVKNGVEGLGVVWHKISDEVKQFGMLAAGYLGFEFISSQLGSIIANSGKLSDSFADIRRVTGMTNMEVTSLNKSFTEMDTRTGTDKLRDIAIIAGKLGIAKEDIYNFTDAVNQMVVALGDELGDADTITTQLGKILNVFEGKVSGESLKHLGNTMVVLANEGVASGGFIADFTQRVSGIAKAANMSLASTMALGASLEEMGGRSESSSTAIQKLIGDINKDVPAAAKIAGASLGEFNKLLIEQPAEAMLRYAEGLVKNKSSFAQVVDSFKDAGEEGVRTVETLMKLGQQGEMVRDKIKLAGAAMQSTDAIVEAFNLKNETLGSTLDRITREFNRMVSSSTVNEFLKSAAENTLGFLRALRHLPDTIREYRTAIIASITTLAIYLTIKKEAAIASALNRTAIFLEIAADKLQAAQTIASTIVTKSYSAFKRLLAGDLIIATIAQRAWNAALLSNPLLWFVALVGITATAISYLTNKFKELTAVEKLNADIKQKSTEAIAEEKAKTESLAQVIKDTSLSYDVRKRALLELQKIIPGHLNNLTLEQLNTKLLTDEVTRYTSALEQKARTEAAISAKSELYKKDIKLAQVETSLSGKVASGKYVANSDLNENEQEHLSSFRKNFIFTSRTADRYTGLNAGKEALSNVQEARMLLRKEIDGIDVIIKESYTQQAKATDDAAKSLANTALKGLIEAIDEKLKIINEAIPKQISEKAIKPLLIEQKKLEAEKSRLLGKEDKKEENEYDKFKKEYAQFLKEVKQLREDVAIDTLNEDHKEIAKVEKKYAHLLNKAKEFVEQQFRLTHKGKPTNADYQQNEAYSNLEQLKQQEISLKLKEIYTKKFNEQSKKEYEQTLQFALDYFEQQRLLMAEQYAHGSITKEAYEQGLRTLETNYTAARILIHKDYANTVKDANKALAADQKKQEEEYTKSLLKQGEAVEWLAKKTNEAKSYLLSAGAKRRDPFAQHETTVEKASTTRDDKVKELKDKLKTAGKDASDEALQQNDVFKQIQDEYNQAVLDADKKLMESRLSIYKSYLDNVTAALSSLNTIMNNMENRQLQQEEARNNKRKKALDKNLKGKLISEGQHNMEVQKMDEELDRKKRKVARDQAARDQAISAFTIAVNTAEGIMKAVAASPLTGGLPFSAIVAAMGALQLGAVLSKPLPELGSGDWVRSGDKHSDSSGGIFAKIERDEAVMAARTMTDKSIYTVTGTPAQITSALQSANNATTWSNGAVVGLPPWFETPQYMQSNVPFIMANGAYNAAQANSSNSKTITSLSNTYANNNATSSIADLTSLVAEVKQGYEQINNSMSQWARDLKINYTASDTPQRRSVDKLYDNARKQSGIN
jgi:TP901 family phage tail tape measure protein